jgi:hypothetical protein
MKLLSTNVFCRNIKFIVMVCTQRKNEIMQSSLLVVVALVVALASAQTVSVVSCQDGQCSTGCQTQSFTAGECLELEGSSDTVELTCTDTNEMCNDLKIYQDAQCSVASEMVLASNVCDSCQSNFTVSCGALHDAVFIASTCTDVACQTCANVTIVPFQTCKQVPNVGYAFVTRVNACQAVTYTTYEGASCTGTKFAQSYDSGSCFDGTTMTCSS